ncbi:hypothetical protein ACFL3C_00255 [Patescibacteria group bacterium]
MKKVFILLVIFALLLTGCSNGNPDLSYKQECRELVNDVKDEFNNFNKEYFGIKEKHLDSIQYSKSKNTCISKIKVYYTNGRAETVYRDELTSKELTYFVQSYDDISVEIAENENINFIAEESKRQEEYEKELQLIE